MHFMQTDTAAYSHPQQDTFHKPASWQVDKASCEPAGPSQSEHMLPPCEDIPGDPCGKA
jgi:hypothetical protein